MYFGLNQQRPKHKSRRGGLSIARSVRVGEDLGKCLWVMVLWVAGLRSFNYEMQNAYSVFFK
jgi:hypothetical protein